MTLEHGAFDLSMDEMQEFVVSDLQEQSDTVPVVDLTSNCTRLVQSQQTEFEPKTPEKVAHRMK